MPQQLRDEMLCEGDAFAPLPRSIARGSRQSGGLGKIVEVFNEGRRDLFRCHPERLHFTPHRPVGPPSLYHCDTGRRHTFSLQVICFPLVHETSPPPLS